MAGNLRAFVAELMGTFAWVFFTAGAVCAAATLERGYPLLCAALAQGLTVTMVFGVFGRYSFGFFNPALTAALFAAGRIDAVKAAMCFLCQLLGAALAGLFLFHIFSFDEGTAAAPPFLGTPVLDGVGFRSATLVEAVLTLFLTVAVARSSLQYGRTAFRARALFIGALAAAAALVAGPLTGAVMNPARAFGPAVASGHWAHHYVYWVGPLAGALAGIAVCRQLFESH